MRGRLADDLKVVMTVVVAVVVPLLLVGGAWALSGWLFSTAYNYVVFDWLRYSEWPRMHWLVGCAVSFLTGALRGRVVGRT